MGLRDRLREAAKKVNDVVEDVKEFGQESGITDAARNITATVTTSVKDVSDKTGLTATLEEAREAVSQAATDAVSTVEGEAAKDDGSLSSKVARAVLTGASVAAEGASVAKEGASKARQAVTEYLGDDKSSKPGGGSGGPSAPAV